MIEIQQLAQRYFIQWKQLLLVFVDFVILLVSVITEIIYAAMKVVIRDDPKDISGEIVLVTGTAHGIGRELALQYTALGSTVICVDINEAGNEETVRIANEQKRGTAYSFKCDVTDRTQVQELSKNVRSHIGTVSVIVNNAGIMISRQSMDHTENEVRKMMDVNVFSQFWIIEAFLPGMLEKSRGHIVAISSMAGIVGLEYLMPYSASKFAVCGLMESLTEEIRKGPHNGRIHTTIVCPYMVDTGLCKVPRMRFPNMLGFVTPKYAATAIIDAHRRNYVQVTIPKVLLYLNAVLRILPRKVAYIVKDFLDSGVDPET